MTCFLKDGYIVPLELLKANCGEDTDKLLSEKLVITVTEKFGPPTVVTLYTKLTYSGQPYIRLPRLWLEVLCGRSQILPPPRILYPARRRIETLEYTGELDHNQKLVVAALLRDHLSEERILAGSGAALLRLEAGRGKTFVAAAMIGALKLRTLYVVPKVPLQKQAVVDMRKVLSGSVSELNTATLKRGALPDVAVVVINTAVKLPSNIVTQFDMVIYDEVQKYRSAQRRSVFRHTMTWVNLGMTATPHRKDGLDMIYKKELAIGPSDGDGVVGGMLVADALAGYRPDDVIFDIRIHVIHYYGPDEYTKNIESTNGTLSALLMQKQFISDPYRMKLIARELSELINWEQDGKKQGIYIFCEEREQLEVVYRALCDEYTIDVPELDKNIRRFTGKTKKGDLKEITQRATILLTTYGFSSEGISNNRMTAEIFCTTRRNNMEQIMGRILRRNGDPAVPRFIIDIIDERTALRHQFKTRKADYDTRAGVTYVHRRVDYTDL